ncbi:hypothetical protein NE237_018716 [Protea cynaroides]|uniref:Uncharacterized protein n=1 Tax=Protea cynaroides TaxID=273540 RepID=A0A9Q0QP91_9MAGN|nr:hypothetical protein NE237_018716 [Protea cynaroides]
MDTSATFVIERKSSIDSEPRTLTMDQLQYAREEALYVAQTKSNDEALSVFTKGLKPVGSAVKDRNISKLSIDDDSTKDCDSFAIHFSLPAAVPAVVSRDIASAPF